MCVEVCFTVLGGTARAHRTPAQNGQYFLVPTEKRLTAVAIAYPVHACTQVQDLTPAQLALFKFVGCNPERGLLLAGDTAQTIAKGTNFRFEVIR